MKAWSDPDSFDHQVEEDWEKRFLSISESGGMFHVSGVLDRVGGSALETAIEALAKRLGDLDARTPKQRRADALAEIAHHAMDKGTLPKRHGVRPHVSIHTTPEGLKRELDAPASALSNGVPVSGKTAQRLACDGPAEPGAQGGLDGDRRWSGAPDGAALAVAGAEGQA